MNSRMKLVGSLTLSLLLGVSACTKKDDDRIIKEDVAFNYFPRECTRILSLPMEEKLVTESTGQTGQEEVVVGEEGVRAKDFLYWLMTGADDLDSLELHYSKYRGRSYEYIYHRPRVKFQLAPGFRMTEVQLLNDYLAGAGHRGISSDRMNAGLLATALIPWEYRVTGVKDFKIVALTPLFGLPAETSLNRFFTFHELAPKQIISSQSKTLLWGYSDQEQVTSIAQWLSMRPMAQPVMMLRLNTMPQEVPVKTRLVTILTTTDGKELRDTLQVLLK